MRGSDEEEQDENDEPMKKRRKVDSGAVGYKMVQSPC